MRIYLDNAATTACSPAAARMVARVSTTDYANPSSMHKMGLEAERYVRGSASVIAGTLSCRESELIFTCGGTESNNLALIGSAMANRRSGRHIVTTAVEHPSVTNPLRFLEERGFEVTYLPADGHGGISADDLSFALRGDTILVSIMMVNNEVGTVFPVEEAARIIREKSPAALFHVDAVQAYGKFPLAPGRTGIDLLAASAHKIHGPKGVGFLYIKHGTKIRPVTFGGGQQGDLRPGTINAPAIAGMGVAARDAHADMRKNVRKMHEMKAYFAQKLSALPDVEFNGRTGQGSAPHILNASFSGVKSEVLLHALEERGIYVSAGSACASRKKKADGTLAAMGLSRKRRESALRFSLSVRTTRQELDLAFGAISELLPVLRRYTRR